MDEWLAQTMAFAFDCFATASLLMTPAFSIRLGYKFAGWEFLQPRTPPRSSHHHQKAFNSTKTTTTTTATNNNSSTTKMAQNAGAATITGSANNPRFRAQRLYLKVEHCMRVVNEILGDNTQTYIPTWLSDQDLETFKGAVRTAVRT